MRFGETPEVSADVMPGMFELHEEVMQRQRHAGNLAWNGRVGIAAPVLPKKKPRPVRTDRGF
jgi:para-nitrobenzyl esterase